MCSTTSRGGIPLLVPVLAPVGMASSSRMPLSVVSWGRETEDNHCCTMLLVLEPIGMVVMASYWNTYMFVLYIIIIE